MQYSDARRDFLRSRDETLTALRKPTIVVAGPTGAGKTSLIRRLLGEIVPEDAVGHGRPVTQVFTRYADDTVNLIDSRGMLPGESTTAYLAEVQSEIRRRRRDEAFEHNIHLVWYCLPGPTARVTMTDIRLIRDVFPAEAVLVALTKMDITRPHQHAALMAELIKHGVAPERIVPVSDLPADKGSAILVEKSLALLPEVYHTAFISKQRTLVEKKAERAAEIITEAVAVALRWGWLPFVDVVPVGRAQWKMVSRLALLYGLTPEQTWTLLGGGILATLGGSAAGGLIMDVLNPLAGMVAGSLLAAAATGGLGILVQDYLAECALAVVNGTDTRDLRPFVVSVEKWRAAALRFYEEHKTNLPLTVARPFMR